MSKKIVLRFTLKELSGLIQDEKSRVILQRCIRKIPLQPYCLNDLLGSIHEELDANLAKFDHELKGVLLSYKNVKIVKNVANMLHDDSRLYITIQADFYLFMPEVGRILRGIVNKKSADHIGCLVHKAFNVAIPRPTCETDGDWKGYYVEIGQEVTFRVESLDLTGSLPYMVGCLLDVRSVPSPVSVKFSEANGSDSLFNGQNTGKYDDIQEPLDGIEDTHSVVDKKKEKKHKKNAGLEGTSDLSFTEDRSSNSILEAETYHSNEMFEENGVDSNMLKATKKKKKKRKSAEHHETLKQKGLIYSRGDEGHSIKELDSYAEQEEEYEGQLSKDKKQSYHSLHVATMDSISSGLTGKKKKRKYSEVFQDKHDYEEPFSVSQDESWTSSKPKKKRKKQISEMANMYEDSHDVNATPEVTDYNIEVNEIGEIVKEQFCNKAEYENMHASQDISQKKKKREKFVKEFKHGQPEEHITDTLEEFTKRIKKKRDETLLAEMSNVKSENNSIDTSQEVTQEKKKKKKKRSNISEGIGDETSFGVTDEPTCSVSHTTMTYNKHLTHSQVLKNVTEEVESKTSLDREYLKKLSKRNKSKEISDIATSTPVEYRNSKVSKVSYKLLDKSDIKQLQLSPVESVGLKTEREIETGMQSLKLKPMKSENMSYLRTENLCSTPLSILQRRENKYKTDHQAENSSQHQIKNDLECILKSSSKPTNRECAKVIPKKGYKAYTSTVQQNSNFSAGVSDSENGSSDSDNIHKTVSTQFVKSKTECSRNADNVPEIEKHKVIHNVSNPNKSVSEKSGKQNKCSQTSQNTDRACSSDSGLSFSLASGDRESGSSAISENIREVSSPHTSYNIEYSLKDEKLVKTPKRKRISSPDGTLTLSSAKKIKKEKESSQQSNVGLSEDAESLETERMKLLAAMVKRLDGGNDEESSLKQETSTHRKKDQGLLSTDVHPSPSSKNTEKRKRKSKDSSLKNNDTVQDLDTADFCRKDVSMRTTNLVVSSPVSNQVSVTGTTSKVQRNLKSDEDHIPIRLQTKVSEKTPKRKKSSDTENSKMKCSSRKETKNKVEKESPKKSETTTSNSTEDLKSLVEETPDMLAERLLQDFLKKRSLC